VVDPAFSVAGSFERYVEHVQAAFAVTRGDQHTLVYANAAFHNLVAPDAEVLLGRPIADAFGGAGRDTTELTALLDRAYRTGVLVRNRRIEPVDESALPLICTVWPDVNPNGDAEHLVIELRAATEEELSVALQRAVAERLLMSALREQDAADVAEESRRSAAFLAAESRRLAESLDEAATLAAMERMSLPYLGDWCIVDKLNDDDTMHRLAIIHPDPAKQKLLETLEGRWLPELGDDFGLPAALRNAAPSVIAEDVDAALANAARDPQIGAALRELGVGPLLTVPLVIRERLIGAITFVGGRRDRPFSPDDIKLADALASRGAMALDRARAFGEAIALRVRAEAANEAKSAFLGMVSHELRTPLNAIGGYVDLIDMELHGPVTEAQRVDLTRIRANQRYLTGLISDLLNLTRVDSGRLPYDLGDILVDDVLAASVALVEPLIAKRELTYECISCDVRIVARGDPEKVIQILVNLLSNSIKFTPPGGRIVADCAATEDSAVLRISDTGIGIPADKLEDIFEPFVQVRSGSMEAEGGIGLGLAISRALAREMQGDLTVESTLGEGARFTLTLPLAAAAREAGE
jgi:signal transduction histidine kinase